MTSAQSHHVRILLLALSMTLSCSEAPPSDSCQSDAQCPALGTACDLERQECICTKDEACADGQFCNSAGVCQAKLGCTANSDCGDGDYCDLDSGKCLTGPALALSAACGLVTHCPYRTVCEAGVCVEGCYNDGDCFLGEVCYDGFCSTGDGLCSQDDFCEYGERCVDSLCEADRRGPYCRGCSFRTALNPEPCDAPKNYCLVNSAESGGQSRFCGVDCSLGQPCPNGYDCGFVVILTEDVCTFDAQCQCDPAALSFATSTCTVADPCDPRLPDGRPDTDASGCVEDEHPQCGGASCFVDLGDVVGSCACATDEDCEDDAVCTSGLCCSGNVRDARDCRVGESRVSGFCSCETDDDCPRDSCDPSRGACSITGKPCQPGGGECGPIPCVNGGCQIGQNCAPLQGLSCTDVQ